MHACIFQFFYISSVDSLMLQLFDFVKLLYFHGIIFRHTAKGDAFDSSDCRDDAVAEQGTIAASDMNHDSMATGCQHSEDWIEQWTVLLPAKSVCPNDS